MAPNPSAAPWKPTREAICCILIASLAFTTVGVARADMITTEHVVTSTPQISSDSVQTFLRRSDVAYQLRSLGVDQSSAEERVAAMTDGEVQAVVGKLDSLYAGGQYVPPALVGAGGVGGAVGAYGGGAYGGVGYIVILLVTGLASVASWGLVQTNTSDPGYTTSTSNPPPMDPNRKISEQDCTKPIVFDGGNLRCK
jgi:hypothetical protein